MHLLTSCSYVCIYTYIYLKGMYIHYIDRCIYITFSYSSCWYLLNSRLHDFNTTKNKQLQEKTELPCCMVGKEQSENSGDRIPGKSTFACPSDSGDSAVPNGCMWITFNLDVSENDGTPKSPILIGFSIVFTIHFGVPLFFQTPISRLFLFLEDLCQSILETTTVPLHATRVDLGHPSCNTLKLKLLPSWMHDWKRWILESMMPGHF